MRGGRKVSRGDTEKGVNFRKLGGATPPGGVEKRRKLGDGGI